MASAGWNGGKAFPVTSPRGEDHLWLVPEVDGRLFPVTSPRGEDQQKLTSFADYNA